MVLGMPFSSSMNGLAGMTWQMPDSNPTALQVSFSSTASHSMLSATFLSAIADSRDGDLLRGSRKEGSHQLGAAQKGHLAPQPQLEGVPVLQ